MNASCEERDIKSIHQCHSCQKEEFSSARQTDRGDRKIHIQTPSEDHAQVRIIICSLDIETARLGPPEGLLMTLLTLEAGWK